MTVDTSQHRFEIKFVSSIRDHDRVRASIFENSLGFKTAYPPRIVNNVYFDTQNLSCFKDNIMGISDRRKLRYRWYGPSFLPQQGNLELKIRVNTYGWKRTFKFDDPQFSEGDWRHFADRLKNQSVREPRLLLSRFYQPVIMNRYQREYLVSSDGLIRATIDIEQIAQPLMGEKTRMNDENFTQIPHVIIEFKAERSQHRQLVSAVSKFPCRVSKNSKYVSAVSTVYNHML